MRRAFSRSDLHQRVLDASVIEHSDPKRPRVKTWCRCNSCKLPEARSYMAVDHIDPLIPLHLSFEQMSLDVVVDRLWCEEHNLQVLCETCHDDKSAAEREERKRLKKGAK